MSYDIYLFDLDGTLLDTLADLHAAVNATMSAFNLPPRTPNDVREFVGNGAKTLLIRSAGGERADVDEMVEYFKEYYREHSTCFTRPYDGVQEMLSRLTAAGKRCGVVSNKPDFSVKQLCKAFFGDKILFAQGEDEKGGVPRKPAPGGVIKALAALGEGKAVYVGDMDTDIQTALNAHLPCLSVTWGFRSEEYLRANGATMIVHTPSEIV